MHRNGGKGVAVEGRACIAIDLKSFYASVECVERGLDPLTTHLVVADESRTDKTICLAVSPSLKAYGLPGRCRLFEARQRLREVNAERLPRAPGRRFSGRSSDAGALASDPGLEAGMVVAKPRMSHYLRQSARIYEIYLRYAAAEDIHVYSVDEVFLDATRYLRARGMTPREMAAAIVRDIYRGTGITATAGIGTNLYLAKVAMDIVAKHIPADRDGVRVAQLDEMSYRRLLWGHRPLTDFWRVGRGYASRLEAQGLMTMGDIARCSLGGPRDYYNEDLLYRMFGVNAELLIDHAWGWEPCTIADIKAYRPEGHSISSGQVLSGATPWATARLITREMADALALELVEQGLVAGRVALGVGYDAGSLNPSRTDCGPLPPQRRAARERAARRYAGPVAADRYGRRVPKPVSGSQSLGAPTDSASRIRGAMAELFDRLVDPDLLVRRITVVADDLAPAGARPQAPRYEQPDLFADAEGEARAREATERADRRDHEVQRAVLDIKRKFGRNAVIKGMDLEQGATGIARNAQIGGHAA